MLRVANSDKAFLLLRLRGRGPLTNRRTVTGGRQGLSIARSIGSGTKVNKAEPTVPPVAVPIPLAPSQVEPVRAFSRALAGKVALGGKLGAGSQKADLTWRPPYLGARAGATGRLAQKFRPPIGAKNGATALTSGKPYSPWPAQRVIPLASFSGGKFNPEISR